MGLSRGYSDRMRQLADMAVAGTGDDLAWVDYLQWTGESEPPLVVFRDHERAGRPLGQARFLDRLEKALGRTVRPIKPGPKVKGKEC